MTGLEDKAQNGYIKQRSCRKLQNHAYSTPQTYSGILPDPGGYSLRKESEKPIIKKMMAYSSINPPKGDFEVDGRQGRHLSFTLSAIESQ
jgi:hypothetical protein